MKNETKIRIKTGWYKFTRTVAEMAPWLAIGTVGGMIVGGYAGAIQNSQQIGRINKRLQRHGELINQHADAGNDLVAKCREDHERLEELEKRQALLMKQALRQVEGSVK